eukprot:c9280_g1_i1.p1 GENE.c9280_g1_i1~~c9280_g1_i1.p1  ORF type:complete len:582 (+),score=118.61 c9280_g1_i1:45-1790(+)
MALKVCFLLFMLCSAFASARRPSHASLLDAKTLLGQHNSDASRTIKPSNDSASNAQFWTALGDTTSMKAVPGMALPYTALASFDDGLNRTGWGILEIWTSPSSSDADQSYAAGYLEGYVTAHHIPAMTNNLLADVFGVNATSPPNVILDFLNEQESWAKDQIEQNVNDPFWAHVGNVFSQYAGLEAGYAQAVVDSKFDLPDLPHWAFQFLNAKGDLIDIVPALIPSMRVDWTSLNKTDAANMHAMRGMCSVLIKLTGNYSDLFYSHSTWFSYVNTNRIYKTYHMAFQNNATAAQTVSFSSYPGMLESLDDFYMMSSGLGMVQTSNEVMNYSAYINIQPHSLLAWQRVRVAAVMAHSGSQWFDVFRRNFSGTYANQYMVVDLNMFVPNKPLQNNLFWVIEEMAGLILGQDQTVALRRGYWASYNIPFYRQVYEASGYPAMVEQAGNFFTYELTPRAQIFRRDQGSVTDIASLKRLLRSNNFQTDPYSFDGQIQNPRWAICARGDLGAPVKAGGCYDTKVTSYLLGAQNLTTHIISGPTTNEGSLPAFSWLAAPFNSKPHTGLPTEYNFDWLEIHPSPNPPPM